MRSGSSVGEFILHMSSLKGLWNDQVRNTSVKLSRKRRAWDLEAADNKGQGGDRQRQANRGDRSTTQETTEGQQKSVMEAEQKKGKAVVRKVKLEEDQKETDGCG